MGALKIIHIEANNLQWDFHQSESQNWIAKCDAIGQVVQADKHSELHMAIKALLDDFFLELMRDNELTEFLQIRGWKLISKVAQPEEAVSFEVPYDLIRAKRKAEIHQRC